MLRCRRRRGPPEERRKVHRSRVIRSSWVKVIAAGDHDLWGVKDIISPRASAGFERMMTLPRHAATRHALVSPEELWPRQTHPFDNELVIVHQPVAADDAKLLVVDIGRG